MRSVLLVLLLASCAGSIQGAGKNDPTTTGRPVDADARGIPSDAAVCHEERPTGTSIAHNVCRSQDQVDTQRKDAQDWEKMSRSNTTNHR